MATSRTGGASVPNTVWALRYAWAWLRPAMPAPMTATPMGSVMSGTSSRRGRGAGVWGPPGRLQQGRSGVTKAVHLIELLILVLDVDRHVRVDGLQRCDEAGPPGDVVPAADGDEIPRRIPGPTRQGVWAAEAEV